MRTLVFTVESTSVGGATQRVNAAVINAIREIGRGGRLVSLNVDCPALIGNGPRDDLAGTREAATILGVSTPRVREMRALAEFAAGPVYSAAELHAFAATRRRTGGRPRKAPPSTS